MSADTAMPRKKKIQHLCLIRTLDQPLYPQESHPFIAPGVSKRRRTVTASGNSDRDEGGEPKLMHFLPLSFPVARL